MEPSTPANSKPARSLTGQSNTKGELVHRSVKANNRLHPSNLRVGTSPSLASVVSNILGTATAILLREEGAVSSAASTGTDTPRSSTASDVGTSVLDVGAKGLVCVAVTAVASVRVERFGVCHGRGGGEDDSWEELHFGCWL